MSVDVEDYFQVSALEPHFGRDQWDSVPCRIEDNEFQDPAIRIGRRR